MLQEFWSYFMTTGNIDTYLNFKEYEAAYEKRAEPSKHEIG